jgi:enoyl-CoA hydratase/carnithine racemase
MGVVHSVVPDVLAVALKRAREIAALPERGVRQVVQWARDPASSWAAQLGRERELLRQALLGGS